MKWVPKYESSGSVRLHSNGKSRALVGAVNFGVRPRAGHRLMALIASAVVVPVLVGCGSMSGKPGFNDKLALQEKVDERMAAADKALKQGQTDQALAQLDSAIQVDPAAKQPWLKKAQIHFEARQYGQAITEAHEVLQRDVRDLTAQSILAVSGLRVSAQALDQLRKVNEVNGSTRAEAESVARIIHEALGEPILLSASAASAPAQASAPAAGGGNGRGRGAVIRPRPAAPVSQAPGAVPASATAPRPAPAPSPVPSARTNPFGALQ